MIIIFAAKYGLPRCLFLVPGVSFSKVHILHSVSLINSTSELVENQYSRRSSLKGRQQVSLSARFNSLNCIWNGVTLVDVLEPSTRIKFYNWSRTSRLILHLRTSMANWTFKNEDLSFRRFSKCANRLLRDWGYSNLGTGAGFFAEWLFLLWRLSPLSKTCFRLGVMYSGFSFYFELQQLSHGILTVSTHLAMNLIVWFCNLFAFQKVNT